MLTLVTGISRVLVWSVMGRRPKAVRAVSHGLVLAEMDGFTTVPHLSGSTWWFFSPRIGLHSVTACVGHESRGHIPPQCTVYHHNHNTRSKQVVAIFC